jgi:hypothetical protein
MRRRSIATGSVLAATLLLALAGCGGTTGSENLSRSRVPAETTPPTTTSDPLEGEWRTEFTCQDSVGAIQRSLSPKEIKEQVGSWRSFLESWGASPTKDDPCNEATGSIALLVRFAGGELALLDGESGELGARARYVLVGDDSIRVDDDEGNLCEGTAPPSGCPVTWRFTISGDALTFRVSPDAFVVGTWEAAPWIRES